jgi:drug/metabolite transporter (DMT)-like permease
VTRNRTVGVFLLVTVLFGAAFPAIKTGLDFFPPLVLAAVRYSVSAVLLLGYAVARTGYWRPRSRRDLLAVLAGGTLFIAGTGFTFLGQQFIASGVAAIIVSLGPVLTVLFGYVLLPTERLSTRGTVGITVGFLGVAVVVRPTPATLFDATVVGKLLVALATGLVALGTVLVRRADPGLPVPALTGWAMAVGASVLVVASTLAGESPGAVRLTPTAVGVALYLGVFAGALAFGLFFWLLDRLGPLEANLVTYLTPVVALVVGRVVLSEPFQPLALAGFAVIVVGFALLKERELAAELAKYREAM